jgi:selenocysteine-specific elongation factor
MAAAAHEHTHVIVGTAGHIDHGKSSLVKRLTGIDPDRLPEEQARGMTIDLGFAHVDLGGKRVSIVDVPGHERFVRNMVAGATGVDMAMLVVAADDGVMPQTREHVDILNLLGIDRGLIVITKVDLVGPERAADAENAVRALVAGTGLSDAPTVRVSNITGAGFEDLKVGLELLIGAHDRRRRSDVFRLPIDRSFSVAGRGTVVTGSLMSGQVKAGEEVDLLPAGRRVRVRGLQSHHEDVGNADAGQRTAVNLAGIKHDELGRGDELATPGFLTSSSLMEVSLRVLSSAARPVASRMKVRVTLATREEIATVIVGAPIAPGTEAFAQFRFREPMVAQFGQRFIFRDETASRTLGGGRVIRPVGLRKWKGTEPEIAALHGLAEGSPGQRVLQVFRDAAQEPPTELQTACRAGVDRTEVAALVKAGLEGGQLIAAGAAGGTKLIIAAEVVADAERTVTGFIEHFHKENPKKLGIPRRELSAALEERVRRPVLEAVLARLIAAKKLAGKDDAVFAAGREPPLSESDRKLSEGLESEIRSGGFAPPEPEQCKAAAGVDGKRLKQMLDLLTAQGRLAFIAPGIYLHGEYVAKLKQLVTEAVGRQGSVAVKDIRDSTGSSRKYVVPLVEYLDKIGFTQRVGDNRVLKK